MKYVLLGDILLLHWVIFSFFSKPLKREIILALWHIWEATPRCVLVHTQDLEWTIKEDCTWGNVSSPMKSEAEWLANSSEWKPAEKVVLTETLKSA